MPRISMWKDGAHTNDYKFFDNRISEMYTVGGTGINVYKYLGPMPQGASDDESQPAITEPDPLAIQDFLFLENRDRKYDEDVYPLRGIYNTADIDFDLSQFGLFLQNDTIFISFHLNDMVSGLGRKLMPGDVLELPHLKDFHGLNTELATALKRFYVVQEGSRPSEGYAPSWWPHLWRVKCTPLTDSQEYQDILGKIQIDESTGESTGATLKDLLSTYKKELEITDKIVKQAEKEVPKSGYDTSKYYTVPAETTGQPKDYTVTPENSNSYDGYLVGDGLPPNGHPVTMGIVFPSNPTLGDYVLRTDFLPNRLFRYNGARWVKVEDSVRTSTTPGAGATQRDGFINNSAKTTRDDNTVMDQRQALTDMLKATED